MEISGGELYCFGFSDLVLDCSGFIDVVLLDSIESPSSELQAELTIKIRIVEKIINSL